MNNILRAMRKRLYDHAFLSATAAFTGAAAIVLAVAAATFFFVWQAQTVAETHQVMGLLSVVDPHAAKLGSRNSDPKFAALEKAIYAHHPETDSMFASRIKDPHSVFARVAYYGTAELWGIFDFEAQVVLWFGLSAATLLSLSTLCVCRARAIGVLIS